MLINDIEFNATEEAMEAFTCFDTSYQQGNDIGPHGMIEEMKSFIRVTNSMRTLIDVGALFGIFSIIFTRNPESTAYALEPSPWAFPILKEQCQLNPERRIVPLQMFAGEVAGRRIQCARQWKHAMPNFGGTGEYCQVEETTIDSLNLDPDCIKIDVESYECAVLRGAKETINRCRPIIFLECHSADLWRQGETPESILKILIDYGYRLERFDGEPVVTLSNCSITRVICRPL